MLYLQSDFHPKNSEDVVDILEFIFTSLLKSKLEQVLPSVYRLGNQGGETGPSCPLVRPELLKGGLYLLALQKEPASTRRAKLCLPVEEESLLMIR